MIKVLRIDDRLMHAQVTFGWTQSMNIKGILIISDKVASDKTMQMAVQFAKPQAVKLWIKNVEEGIAALPKLNSFDYNTMVLVESVSDAKKITQASDCIRYVNMGGMRNKEGRKPILGTIYVSDEDLADLKSMEESGIEVEVRKMITDTGYRISEFI